ncbi:substrate-binding periplasmic protein [Alkalihalobacillus sp. 1P02AB]|uniref:substrate-binding periplasmic protein n=1 Tax=Alkalihalobacillus sp. 1P02AB TaxID=3132260 RepID=UPI0039A5E411
MSIKHKLFSLIAGISALALVGCGSTETNSHEANGNSVQAEDSSLQRIQDSGKIVIGTTGNYRPYTYMDESNQLVGYDIEWGHLIAEGLGVEPEFVTGQFSGLLPGLTADRFDIILSGVNITDERKESIDFSIPYSMDGAVAVIKKGTNAVADITEIDDKVVGVNAGSAFDAAVREIGGYKELREYPGAAESFADLIAERLDVVAIGMVSAGEYMTNSSSGEHIEIVGEPFDIKNVGVALKKNSPELQEAINEIIEENKENGTYDQLTEEYFGITFDN